MARIRSIKPEFWTDEKIVQLPYEARLMFIGLWNFCDDGGFLWDEPRRIKMQIMPDDDVDAESIIDLLSVVGLIDIYENSDGKRFLAIKHFADHQKVDHPVPSKIIREDSRKVSIPSSARRMIATKYGCEPGVCYVVHYGLWHVFRPDFFSFDRLLLLFLLPLALEARWFAPSLVPASTG